MDELLRADAVAPCGNMLTTDPKVLAHVFDAPAESFEGEVFTNMEPGYGGNGRGIDQLVDPTGSTIVSIDMWN